LKRRENHGEVPRVLVHNLAALLALFFESLERRRNGRHQLNDDGRRDIRHDVQCKDRHPVDAAAGKHVEHAENAAGLGIEDLFPGVGIDSRERDVSSEAINQQRADGEPDSLLEFFGFGERREIKICCQLFRCRDHGRSTLPLSCPLRPRHPFFAAL
jgi:hypothetical protein